MIKTIFLLAVFNTHGFSTVTNLTPMPDMETCKKAEELLYSTARDGKVSWSESEPSIEKPIKTDCVGL